MLLKTLVLSCNSRRQRQEDSKFEANLGEVSKTLSQKQSENKRAGDIAQVVEGLPSQHEALSSIPSTVTKKKFTEISSCPHALYQ
jgi:hypothetical protein